MVMAAAYHPIRIWMLIVKADIVPGLLVVGGKGLFVSSDSSRMTAARTKLDGIRKMEDGNSILEILGTM